jgi:hypothetical protein
MGDVIKFPRKSDDTEPPICSAAGYGAIEKILTILFECGPSSEAYGGVATNASYFVGALDRSGFRIVPISKAGAA